MGIGTTVLAGAEEGTDVAHEEHGHRHQHNTGERQAKPQKTEDGAVHHPAGFWSFNDSFYRYGTSGL